MRIVRRLIAVVLLVLWAPVTSHCSWEPLVDSQLFKCIPISHNDAAETGGDCSSDADACGTVESGEYKIPNHGPTLQAPSFALVLFELPILESIRSTTLVYDPAPPEIPSSWRFSMRAALLPRAPSAA